jgi:hypothetical protein
MTDKYQVSLKALRSITAKIDESLPSPDIVTLETSSTTITNPVPGPAANPIDMLTSLQGYVAAFNLRIQSAHTLVTPVGPIGLDNITSYDDTHLLLPRNTIGSEIVFDRRWRRLAAIYYLPLDIAIGYMCIPQRTQSPNEVSHPIGQVALQQIIANGRDLATTRGTRLLLAIGSISGFDKETEDYVGSGLSNDSHLHICLVNLGIESGFLCKYSDPSVTWGVRYFIPEFPDEILEDIKREIRKSVNLPGTSVTRTEVRSILDCSMNYVDLAFIDLIDAGGYVVLSDPQEGLMLKKQ